MPADETIALPSTELVRLIDTLSTARTSYAMVQLALFGLGHIVEEEPPLSREGLFGLWLAMTNGSESIEDVYQTLLGLEGVAA